MKTCLENCKPGDIIHFSNKEYKVSRLPIDGKVYVEYIASRGDKRKTHFLYHSVDILDKIVKAK